MSRRKPPNYVDWLGLPKPGTMTDAQKRDVHGAWAIYYLENLQYSFEELAVEHAVSAAHYARRADRRLR